MPLLHYCALRGNDRLANILIGRGADVNVQESSWFRWTPLHEAVRWNKINVVKVMLSHDSDGVTLDTTLRDGEGKTALDLAREENHEGCVQLLVDHESAKAAKQQQQSGMEPLLIVPERKLSVPIIRIILLGETDVGKTSLALSLSKKKIERRENNTSTLGVDMSTVVIGDDSNDVQEVITGTGSDEALTRQVATLIRQGSRLQPESCSSPNSCPSTLSPSTASSSSSSSSSNSSSSSVHVHGDVLEAITSRVTSEQYVRDLSRLIANNSMKVLRIWDTAGQDCFRVLHHMTFGAERTSYVIVYNAKCSIKEVADESNVRVHGEHRPYAGALPGQPSLAYVHDALETIHNNLQDGCSCRVFLAGCHIDERQTHFAAAAAADVTRSATFNAELDKERDDIIQSIACQPFKHLLKKEDIFFIDNTVSGQEGVAEDNQLIALRQELCMQSQQQDSIPMSRLLETLSIMELSVHPDLRAPWITRHEMEEMLRRVNPNPAESVDDMLAFQHSSGTALYYPDSEQLRENIVIKVTDVMKLSAALLQPCVTRNDLGDEHVSLDDIQRLHRGLLSDKVALCLWKKFCPHLHPLMLHRQSRNFYFRLMARLDILCQAGKVQSHEEDGDVGDALFFMPAAAAAEKLSSPRGATSEEMILSSKDGCHFPHSTFLRLATSCLSHYNTHHGTHNDASWANTALSKCAMRLPLPDKKWLVLRYMKCGIGLRVEANSPRYEFREGHGVSVLAMVHKQLESVLTLANKQLKLKELVKCGCGTMNQHVLCTLHGRAECCRTTPDTAAAAAAQSRSNAAATCFHTVVSVELGSVPMCPAAYYEGHHAAQSLPEGALRFWKAWKQDDECFIVRSENPSSGNSHSPASEGTLCPVASQPVATSAVTASVTASQPVATSATTGSVATSQPVATSAAADSVAASQPGATSAVAGSVTASQPVATSAVAGSVAASQPVATSAVAGSVAASQPVATSAAAGSVAASQPEATPAVTGSVAASQPVATSAVAGSVAASQPEATSAVTGSVAASQPVATSAVTGSVAASQAVATSAVTGSVAASQPVATSAVAGSVAASQPEATSAVTGSVAASPPVATSAASGSVAASQPEATSAVTGSVAASQPEATSATSGSIAASQPVATSAVTGSVVASLIASPAVALLVASLLAAAAASVASVASPIAAAPLAAAAAVLAAVALSAAASPVAPPAASAAAAAATTDEDEESYGDPFKQSAFITDISPWLDKLPAAKFRELAQVAGFFSDLQQIEDLKRIERQDGTRTHNENLVNIVSSEEQAGYIKLVKVIKCWGKYPDKIDKMNQLLPRRARV
ncbi:uncharacterized protein LOC135823887 isoform X3 [Sycon ciliatum]|uniref:uncharacterized protein LOC135823887 isoform X3 n=1 Tax=Sycon ciliatum TaxID=27933 RepID=UPI0031F62A4E